MLPLNVDQLARTSPEPVFPSSPFQLSACHFTVIKFPALNHTAQAQIGVSCGSEKPRVLGEVLSCGRGVPYLPLVPIYGYTEQEVFWSTPHLMPPMFFTIFLTICLITLASAFPHQRRQEKARIVSHCTVPNTVALSFVWKTDALMGDDALICSSF